ncbi:MAG: hypothetical protein ACK5HT_06370 [Draconibacterium sp.]
MGQVKHTQKLQLEKISTQPKQGSKPAYFVFPINGGTVSATPISIPGPNNTPVVLQSFAGGIKAYSNRPVNPDIIKECSFLSFNNNELKVRVFHNTMPEQGNPLYIGAWFYDVSGNALNIGYIPQKVSSELSTDFIMKFNSYPVSTSYLEVMLIQNGNTLTKKQFKAPYKWEKLAKTQQLSSSSIPKINPAIYSGKISESVPDLEIATLKIMDKNDNLLDFGSTCLAGKKLLFISNAGTKKSAPYQVLVSYYKKTGGESVYTELEKILKPPLLPGKQTTCLLDMPDVINNIQINFLFPDGNNGETNYGNNALSRRCKILK